MFIRQVKSRGSVCFQIGRRPLGAILLRRAIRSLLKKYHFDKLTVVADAGMLSEENLAFLTSLNLGYIVGARLKKR